MIIGFVVIENEKAIEWSFKITVADYPDPPDGRNWKIIEPGVIPICNPLKGYVPYTGYYTTFEHSMEYDYISVREVVIDSPTNLNFSLTDDFLSQVSALGHQAGFRLYFDFPGTSSTGVPQYLIDDGLVMTPYDHEGGGLSPDYDDPRIVQLMVSLIGEMGSRYDGDPRIGFIEVGLLGHWGEWHTYPRPELFANKTTQNTVLASFDTAFNQTLLLARYPDEVTIQYNIGFHDDSFGYSTIGDNDWFFNNLIENAGAVSRWKEQPIGGEIYPPVMAELYVNPRSLSLFSSQAQDLMDCIITTHASWTRNFKLFSPQNYNFTGEEIERARITSKRFGYTFAICRSLVNITSNPSYNIDASIQVANFGVAPFYYPWPVEFGILDQAGTPLQVIASNHTLDGIFPGDEVIWSFQSDQYFVDAKYIAVRVPNVMAGGLPVTFANQGLLDEGWTVIDVVE